MTFDPFLSSQYTALGIGSRPSDPVKQQPGAYALPLNLLNHYHNQFSLNYGPSLKTFADSFKFQENNGRRHYPNRRSNILSLLPILWSWSII